jgi:hypothetical protein
MGVLAGRWLADPPLGGPLVVVVDGVRFNLPEGALLKRVQAGKRAVVHAKLGTRVIVLSSLGVLIESDLRARARAQPHAWTAIQGDLL